MTNANTHTHAHTDTHTHTFQVKTHTTHRLTALAKEELLLAWAVLMCGPLQWRHRTGYIDSRNLPTTREESIKALSIAHSSDTMCIHTYKCSYIMHTNVRTSYTIGTYLTLYIHILHYTYVHNLCTLYIHILHYTYVRTYVPTMHMRASTNNVLPLLLAQSTHLQPQSSVPAHNTHTKHVLYTCIVHMYCTHVCIGRYSTTLHSTVAQIHSYVTPPPPPHQHYNSTLCTFTAR